MSGEGTYVEHGTERQSLGDWHADVVHVITGSMSISVSGMQVASTRLDVTASNVANTDTLGYQARSATVAAWPSGGVAVTEVIAPAGAPAALPGTSNVDLAAQMTSLVSTKITYAANARAFEIERQMQGSLFDERA